MMKNPIVLLMTLIAALIITVSASKGAVVVDGPVARNKFMRDVMELFYNEKFGDLEQLAKNIRSTKARFPEGHWKLMYFYNTLSTKHHELVINTVQNWDEVFSRMDKWQRMYPNSVTARTAAASALISYGWSIRGSGYAGTNDNEAWVKFEENSKKAYALANMEPLTSRDDCPHRYVVLLNFARAFMTREKYFEIFDKAVKYEPKYYSYYNEALVELLPRWSGEEGEWVSFLDKVDSLAEQQNSREIYTRMAISSRYAGEWKEFADSHLSWSKMKQGFMDMEKAFPDSPYNLNNFAAFACVAGDKDSTRTILNRIGNSPYSQAWQDAKVDFDKCRAWAIGDVPQYQIGMQAIKRAAKDQESIQMLQLAKDGDITSQYMAAISYDNKGVWDIADGNIAINWYKILAERGIVSSMIQLGQYYDRIATNTRYFNKQLADEEEQIALRYYKLAAIKHDEMKNDELAKATLSSRYFHGGIGVGKDYVKAYGWLLNTKEDAYLWMFLHIKEQKVNEVRGYITDTILKNMNAVEKIKAKEEAEKIKNMILQASDPESIKKFNRDLRDLTAYEKEFALKIKKN